MRKPALSAANEIEPTHNTQRNAPTITRRTSRNDIAISPKEVRILGFLIDCVSFPFSLADLRLLCAISRKVELHRRRNNQRQHHRNQNPSNDSDRKRLQHLGARTPGQSKRKHSSNCCHCCHHNWPQTAPAPLQKGL